MQYIVAVAPLKTPDIVFLVVFRSTQSNRLAKRPKNSTMRANNPQISQNFADEQTAPHLRQSTSSADEK
jgi:hypothetical protein